MTRLNRLEYHTLTTRRMAMRLRKLILVLIAVAAILGLYVLGASMDASTDPEQDVADDLRVAIATSHADAACRDALIAQAKAKAATH
jgi:hypothetical protein